MDNWKEIAQTEGRRGVLDAFLLCLPVDRIDVFKSMIKNDLAAFVKMAGGIHESHESVVHFTTHCLPSERFDAVQTWLRYTPQQAPLSSSQLSTYIGLCLPHDRVFLVQSLLKNFYPNINPSHLQLCLPSDRSDLMKDWTRYKLEMMSRNGGGGGGGSGSGGGDSKKRPLPYKSAPAAQPMPQPLHPLPPKAIQYIHEMIGTGGVQSRVSAPPPPPNQKSVDEEEDHLQMALALSVSETEEAERKRKLEESRSTDDPPFRRMVVGHIHPGRGRGSASVKPPAIPSVDVKVVAAAATLIPFRNPGNHTATVLPEKDTVHSACTICMTHIADIMTPDCGHRVSCIQCIENLRKPDTRCPVCSKPIRQFCIVY